MLIFNVKVLQDYGKVPSAQKKSIPILKQSHITFNMTAYRSLNTKWARTRGSHRY